MVEPAKRSSNACDMHGTDTIRTDEGPNTSMQEDVNRNVQDDTYGPWVVVTHKRHGTKAQRSGGPSSLHDKWKDMRSDVRERLE